MIFNQIKYKWQNNNIEIAENILSSMVRNMKLIFMQFYFSVIKQEEEVNNNTEEMLQTLLRRYTTKIRSK